MLIPSLFPHKAKAKLNSHLMNQLIISHITHLNDSHFKVVPVCIQSLVSFLPQTTVVMLPFLDNIIEKVREVRKDSKYF